MTILGRGDLSPPRRYGRRRGRPLLTAAVVLALLGAAASVGWWWTGRPSPSASQRPLVCTTPSASPSAPRPSDVRLAVRNGTGRVGLAHTVAAALHARGYAVTAVGNTTAVAGASRVAYGNGGLVAATVLAAQVPGAVLVPDPALAAGTVELDIGTSYTTLGPMPPPSTSTPSPICTRQSTH